MVIRFANCQDSHGIAALAGSGFKDEISGAIIYGADGIEAYLKSQISIESNINDSVYIVAENDNKIVGFVEFRNGFDCLFLNFIGISSLSRNKGVAKKLLKQAVIMSRSINHKKISLDVFSDNEIARKWYMNLGFIPEYTTNWYRIKQTVKFTDFVAKVSGFSQSKICYSSFGFSQFTLNTIADTYSIGFLGDKWFRVTQPEILIDVDALACLNSIDPNRHILGLFRDDINQVLPSNSELFCSSIRMSLEIGIFEKNISLNK
jgi:ribosomal protein S18 acetylase RimI-like enzyme